MKKTTIISTHIENDVRNGSPTIVYTDVDGIEWVYEEQTSSHGYITALVQKDKSWYWKKD
jgi:hypothetical protein